MLNPNAPVSLVVPEAPAIAGLVFRPLQGEADVEAVYALRTECAAADGVDPLSTLESWPTREQLREMLAGAAAAGQHDQWLMAQVHERMMGYARLAGWPELDGTWVCLVLGWVLPEWRGRGLGTAMLRWTEGRVRRLAATDHPGEKAEFAANASSTETAGTALLLQAGYAAAYTALEMGWDRSTPLPAPALPAGLELRPAQAEHYPLIAASVVEAYQHEYENNRFNQGDDPAAFVAEISEPKHDPALWQVAWEGDQIAGQVLAVIERGRAEVFEVSVRPAWRRRG